MVRSGNLVTTPLKKHAFTILLAKKYIQIQRFMLLLEQKLKIYTYMRRSFGEGGGEAPSPIIYIYIQTPCIILYICLRKTFDNKFFYTANMKLKIVYS